MSLIGDSVYGTSSRADVFRVSTDGTLLWLKNVGLERETGYRGMAGDTSGCVYVAANARYNWAALTGDIEVSKLDPDGNIVWTTVYDNPFGRIAWANGITVDQ